MPAPDLSDARLLAFARRLQSLESFDALVDELCREVREAVGYHTAWLALFDQRGDQVRILSVQGEMAERVWESSAIIPVEGDPYMVRIRDERTVQIIEDAQVTEDVNREIVEALGNRTIVNVPLALIDRAVGAIGTGTFGDQGVRLPSEGELRYLEGMAQQLVMASARLLLDKQREEAAAEREALQRKLEERHRLESLGRLAGEVAHEFNNLLTVMVGGASLLLADEDDPERAEELQAIVHAGEGASQLARKLLALGKKQPLQLRALDLRDCLEDAVDIASRVLPDGVTLTYEAAADAQPVNADMGQIRRLLLNLLINARDAMPDGGPITLRSEPVTLDEAYVRANPWARPGRYARIVVEDRGEGMTPEILGQIFEPFFTTKQEERGSGLGLAICRAVVEQHGGFVHATSAPGEGSTFEVLLPASAQDQPAEQGLDEQAGEGGADAHRPGDAVGDAQGERAQHPDPQ